MKPLLPAALAFCGWLATVHPASAQSWQSTGAPNNPWLSPACSADGTKLVAKVGNYLLSSTNTGATWFTSGAPFNPWTCVAMSADGVKLVASAARIFNPAGGNANGGPIYTSTDSGATWSQANVPSNQWASVASSADGVKLVAVAAYNYSNTAYGSIYVSTNSGADWTVTSAPTNNWKCVASSADGTRLIAGCGDYFRASSSGIFISTDSGASWTSNSVSTNFSAGFLPVWTSVASSADGSCLMGMRVFGSYNGANRPLVYTSTNYGVTWISKELPTVGSGFVAMSADGGVLMASKGRLYISTDAGVTWLQQNIPGLLYGWGSGCVASSADGNKLYLVLGADDFSQPNSIFTSYTAPKPQLKLKSSSTNLALCWMISATNFIVQQNPDLSATNWVTLTNAPTFNPATLQNQINLSPSNGSGFFRLRAK
ncbi:MAG: sialidase family protein [Limisphaerales bacterium]